MPATLISEHLHQLRQLLRAGPTKANRDRMISWIGHDPEKMAALMELFQDGGYREVQQLAWVVGTVGETHSGLLDPYLPDLVGQLRRTDVHDGVKRNILRLLQFAVLPEEVHAELISISFQILSHSGQAIAIRVFAMGVLARLAVVYPEIGGELLEILELELQKHPSPGFLSRARKIQKQLKTHRLS